eukprot:366236-Chlamydomonas_euryale.AAC.6
MAVCAKTCIVGGVILWIVVWSVDCMGKGMTPSGVQHTQGRAHLSLADACAKHPAMPAWQRMQGRTQSRKRWEHSERGRGLSQRSNAFRVRKAASKPLSTFPVEYRRADFGVEDPFTQRECSVEWGPLTRYAACVVHTRAPTPSHQVRTVGRARVPVVEHRRVGSAACMFHTRAPTPSHQVRTVGCARVPVVKHRCVGSAARNWVIQGAAAAAFGVAVEKVWTRGEAATVLITPADHAWSSHLELTPGDPDTLAFDACLRSPRRHSPSPHTPGRHPPRLRSPRSHSPSPPNSPGRHPPRLHSPRRHSPTPPNSPGQHPPRLHSPRSHSSTLLNSPGRHFCITSTNARLPRAFAYRMMDSSSGVLKTRHSVSTSKSVEDSIAYTPSTPVDKPLSTGPSTSQPLYERRRRLGNLQAGKYVKQMDGR